MATKKKVLSDAEAQRLVKRALELLYQCENAEAAWEIEGSDPGDAQVYVLRRDVWGGNVRLVLEALGLKSKK